MARPGGVGGRPGSGPPRRGLTITELSLAFAVLVVLLAVLIPSMHRARIGAWRDQSQANLRVLHRAWVEWLDEHDGRFPFVPSQPSWQWGGVRHSSVTGRPFLDTDRPLSLAFEATAQAVDWFRCPADSGITGETPGVGTGERTCYEAFGTSYRANPRLLDARLNVGAGMRIEGDLARGLRLGEIATAPSRLMILGEPLWAEVLRGTGLDADWYDQPGHANLLFLDGRVSFEEVVPGGGAGSPVFEPQLRWVVRPMVVPPAGAGAGPGAGLGHGRGDGSAAAEGAAATPALPGPPASHRRWPAPAAGEWPGAAGAAGAAAGSENASIDGFRP